MRANADTAELSYPWPWMTSYNVTRNGVTERMDAAMIGRIIGVDRYDVEDMTEINIDGATVEIVAAVKYEG